MNSDIMLLNKIYINSVTAINALSSMLRKTNENTMYDCLFEQIINYREIANNAKKRLDEYNFTPTEKNPSDSLALSFAVNFIGLGKISPKRLAKIMISGSREGIYDIVAHVNSCTDASQNSRLLAYRLIGVEEQNINKMNSFL